MRFVGFEEPGRDEMQVHTIDVWLSPQRGVWIVERLNANGDLIGTPHACASAEEAHLCVEHWSRTHSETVLIAPIQPPRRQMGRTSHPKRKAA